jgi:hypothetical protein
MLVIGTPKKGWQHDVDNELERMAAGLRASPVPVILGPDGDVICL